MNESSTSGSKPNEVGGICEKSMRRVVIFTLVTFSTVSGTALAVGGVIG